MGQLKSLERRLQKDDPLRKRYQENIDTEVKAGYVREVEQVELNETRQAAMVFATSPYHQAS